MSKKLIYRCKTMKKTTLVILAAGIGSRFGEGIKQLTRFGKAGELIIDYSIHDAIEAGFNKVVFLIRRDLEEEFRTLIGDRVSQKIEVAYAYQSLDDLPEGFTSPETRKKPWGTGQALLCCRDVVNEPFAVINADDYYGKEAFRACHAYLEQMLSGKRLDVCMVGFVLKNTLSENGGVTRGICSISPEGHLRRVTETYDIHRVGKKVKAQERDISPESTVSMNFWGFTPDVFPVLEEKFKEFLEVNINESYREYLLPTIVDELVRENKASVSVLMSPDTWFGVTYRADVPKVKQAIEQLVADGVYPETLY